MKPITAMWVLVAFLSGIAGFYAGHKKSELERIAVLEQQFLDLSEAVGSTQADLATALETDKDQDARIIALEGK